MKNILLVLAVFVTINSYGQNLIDANGDVIATIDSVGSVFDGAGSAIGEFAVNGDVNDGQGTKIGSIINNEFRDGSGAVIGTMDTNSNVFDMNGSQIGSIQAGLLVIDANNHVMGRASAPIDTKYLASYFFYFFNIGI